MNKTINALVVEDQPVYRNGIVKILSSLEFVENCNSAENGQVAIDKFLDMQYNVVFMDIEMPVMDGIKATKIIKERFPDTIIIILSMFNIKKQVIELLEMGVNGYILKTTDEEEIIKALMLIAEGRQYFTDSVYKIWADHCINKSALLTPITNQPKLSVREIEIVKLICEQRTAKNIADFLCVSESTVNNHRSHIMQKIGVDNTVGVVIYAIEHGIFII
jgi:two-component system response regulator DegU